MALFPDAMPRVEPEMDDAAFWDHCRRRELKFQSCARCNTPRHPPTPVCGACRSTEVAWVEAPAEAEVYSYTVVHYASHPAVAGNLPYVVVLAVFPGLPGVRLVSNLTGCDPAGVSVGMKIALWWDDVGDGMHLPRFRPA